jgi:NitT/TauT family transport system ATP-binding protein
MGMSSASDPFLSMSGVSYDYRGQLKVVDAVDWQIARGEFHCLVGRSGCGKTTLLKLASGLYQPDKGAIHVDGQRLEKPLASLGFVFQSPTLLEWKTVIDNVLLPIVLQRKPNAQDKSRAAALLEQLGLSGLLRRYPGELSGGQQSRVALARALIMDPGLLLLDEPFAALDAMTREELQDDLLATCHWGQTTVLFVTHDISEAVYLSDRIAVMSRGRIVEDLAVPLPRPRLREMRYGQPFNELCAKVRQTMDGCHP